MSPRGSVSRLAAPLAPAAARGRRPYAYAVGGAGVVAALAVSAVANHYLAKKAERDNPAPGRFVDVGGVQLHYVDRGSGPAVVLLHGNGSMIQDFAASGLLDLAARKYRVIAFDRPGFGYTRRPRGTVWTPKAQAELVHKALEKLGVTQATIVGHSWGCSVAVALGLQYPAFVSGLVLASGYYYPSARADVLGMSAPALPILGDLIRYSLSPILARLMWPLLTRKIFDPAPVPKKFEGFPREMTFRPSQIRASAAESALMIPAAIGARDHYADLKMPVVIIAGEGDSVIEIDDQSARLHNAVSQSTFHRIRGAGHMVHQTATNAVIEAIDEAASQPHSTGQNIGIR